MPDFRHNGTTFFDDVLLVQTGPSELLRNSSFAKDIEDWSRFWGSHVAYNSEDGYITAESALKITADRFGFAGVSQCVDLTERADIENQYVVNLAVKTPAVTAPLPFTGVILDYFTNTNCASLELDDRLIFDFQIPNV